MLTSLVSYSQHSIITQLWTEGGVTTKLTLNNNKIIKIDISTNSDIKPFGSSNFSLVSRFSFSGQSLTQLQEFKERVINAIILSEKRINDSQLKINQQVEPPNPAEDEIFTEVEQQAEFPGGPRAFGAFLQRNLKYPSAAQRAKVGGKVYVQFIINTDGTIEDVQVFQSIGFGCDEEAIRVIKSVPKWNPGKQSGRAVRSRFTQPITFVLSE